MTLARDIDVATGGGLRGRVRGVVKTVLRAVYRAQEVADRWSRGVDSVVRRAERFGERDRQAPTQVRWGNNPDDPQLGPLVAAWWVDLIERTDPKIRDEHDPAVSLRFLLTEVPVPDSEPDSDPARDLWPDDLTDPPTPPELPSSVQTLVDSLRADRDAARAAAAVQAARADEAAVRAAAADEVAEAERRASMATEIDMLRERNGDLEIRLQRAEAAISAAHGDAADLADLLSRRLRQSH